MIVLFLSVVINIVMLATWDAKGALGQTTILANATSLPGEIQE